jgi:hypothetical protein
MSDDPGPEVLVAISDQVPDDHRDAIHNAVTVMAKRSRDAALRAFERNRARNLLTQRVNAPLRALINADPDAAAALADMSTPRVVPDSLSTPRMPDVPRVTFQPSNPAPLLEAFAAPQVFGAPWGYQWQWHNGQPPGTSSQDRTSGQISIRTTVDDSTIWSDAHGGFGVSMTSDQVRSVVGRSLRRTTHYGEALAGPLGGTATAEGGMEMTVLDGSTLLSSAQDKRFRVRSSSGELHYDDGQDGAVTGDAIEVEWVMLPGHVYTFNVGCWAFAEAHGSLGTGSYALARINGLLIAMTAAFTD